MLPSQSSQASQPKARDDSYPLQKNSLSTGLSAEGEGADQDEGFDERDDSPAKRQRVYTGKSKERCRILLNILGR